LRSRHRALPALDADAAAFAECGRRLGWRVRRVQFRGAGRVSASDAVRVAGRAASARPAASLRRRVRAARHVRRGDSGVRIPTVRLPPGLQCAGPLSCGARCCLRFRAPHPRHTRTRPLLTSCQHTFQVRPVANQQRANVNIPAGAMYNRYLWKGTFLHDAF